MQSDLNARTVESPGYPESVRLMLASKIQEPFDSADWIYELKWGGVRSLAFLDNGKVTLRGQNGSDLSEIYPELNGLPGQLIGRSAILDGEIIALSPDGVPSLDILRRRLEILIKGAAPRLPRAPLSYQIADIIALDGESLAGLPLWQRKNILHACLRPSKLAQACDFIEAEGTAFFDAVCEHSLEGIVAKNKYSRYQPGQLTRDWLEIAARKVSHYVIGGYTFGGGDRRRPFESLLLGAFNGSEFIYVGRATAGLSNPDGWRTVRLLEGLHASSCPFVTPPLVNRFSYWCEPKLVCQVEVGELDEVGRPRFAIFAALRPDISPNDCAV